MNNLLLTNEFAAYVICWTNSAFTLASNWAAKTEGFIHKKVDHKALPWIETRCQEEMETDHYLLDPLTDKQTQEETGVDQMTLILKTQGSTHKKIRHTPILLRETLGGEEKIVCLNLLHPHTHNLKIV